MIKRIKARLLQALWNISHRRWVKKLKKRLANDKVTILSPNCTGGVMYHDLGLQFASPTVNLFMRADDYLKFLENLPHYCNMPLKPYNGPVKRDYPLADLDGLTLYLVHYASAEEAAQKWRQRAARIHWDNLVVLATDRDGMTAELMERFDKLPYPKVMFVKNAPTYHWQVQIHNCVEDNQVGTILHPNATTLKAALKGKRYYDEFDWIGFLNGEKHNETKGQH